MWPIEGIIFYTPFLRDFFMQAKFAWGSTRSGRLTTHLWVVSRSAAVHRNRVEVMNGHEGPAEWGAKCSDSFTEGSRCEIISINEKFFEALLHSLQKIFYVLKKFLTTKVSRRDKN